MVNVVVIVSTPQNTAKYALNTYMVMIRGYEDIDIIHIDTPSLLLTSK